MDKQRTLPILVALFGLAVPAVAELSDEEARSLAARARGLQAAGEHLRAVQWVSDEFELCTGDPCRNRLAYTLGYLYAEESRRVAAPANAPMLRLAAEKFAVILERRPHHWPTVANLAEVYVRLGDDRSAEALLRDALDADDPDRRAAFALALGDLYRRQKRTEDAVEAYRLAVTALPGRSTPKRREIEAISELLPSRIDEMMERLRSWEAETPEIARRGYREILTKAWEIDFDIAEHALLRWLDLVGRDADRTAGGDLLQRLPSDWWPVKELEAFVAEPAATHLSSWWFESSERSDALAPFVLAVGRSQRSTREAHRVWLAALDLQPPRPLTAAWEGLYDELHGLLE